MKILHLTDLHDCALADSSLLEKSEVLRPDVIAITGDVLDECCFFIRRQKQTLKKGMSRMITLLNSFKCPWKFFVPGNNEQVETAEYFYSELEKQGWHILSNRSMAIEFHNHRIWFAGVDDPHTDKDNFPAAMKEIAPWDQPVIFLSHSPDIIGDAVAADIDIVLSGHTHGGQICLPGIGALITETKLFKRWADGLHLIDNTWLFINRGMGYSTLPVRCCCPPEMALLTLARGVKKSVRYA